MARTIDINDWVLSGGGGVGVSYFHKADPSLILKIDNRDISETEVEEGLKTARIVYGLGIPTPEPGEVVFDGQRYGQVFRRIQGKVSYARLTGEKPEEIPQLAHDFAGIVRMLHSTRGIGTGLRSIKETYGSMVSANPLRPKGLLDKACRFLQSLPDADTCVHGDLHFGNMIKAGGKSYLIDISSFSYGHPYFDIAMMVAIHGLAPGNPSFHRELFHCEVEQSHSFWQHFITEYFGEGVTEQQVRQMVTPFLAIRILTMETETRRPIPMDVFPEVRDLLESL